MAGQVSYEVIFKSSADIVLVVPEGRVQWNDDLTQIY